MKIRDLCRVAPAILLLTSITACNEGRYHVVVEDAPDSGRDAGSDGDKQDADTNGDASAAPCPQISFVTPVSGADLSEADDRDGDRCENGFQYDIRIATTASDGAKAMLYAGNNLLAEAEVSGAVVQFEGVQLSANADTTLKVQVGRTTCSESIPVSVSCSVPSCQLSKPALSDTHPLLNGVPVANGGDRVSSAGSAYQVEVEVSTSVEDGQLVQLSVDDSDVLLSTTAQGGKAVFPGVTLEPDGEHFLSARCTARTGTAGTSERAIFVVDSEAPELTIASPAPDAHFELVPSFEVCATSSSDDARDLPEGLGAEAQQNLCGAIGGATPNCVEMTSTTEDDATFGRGCVQIGCPGGPPFDVTVTLRDAAGNRTSKVLSGITCRTDLPSVEIVSPTATIAGDPSTRILAANAAQARKDANASTAGAQFTVVACTEVEGGEVRLRAGHADGSLTEIGTPMISGAAETEDNCPAGKPYVAKFVNVTLPESRQTAEGALDSATRIVAAVTDESNTTGTSPNVDVWVDSIPPTLGASLPAPLCGHFKQSAGEWTTEIRLNSSVLPVSMTVTRPDQSQQTYTGTTYAAGLVTSLGNVTFGMGVNTLQASVTEPSGNVASLADPCQVTVGDPPVVTWVNPTASSKLGVTNDADSVQPGWQGTLVVHTDLAGTTPTPTVQFATAAGGAIGAPVPIDGNGDATLADVTLPDAASVTLTATTSSIPDRGVGSAAIAIPVDTIVPAPPETLAASSPEDKRRQTTFRLTWTAPSDGGQAAMSYEVRVSTAPIDETNFEQAEDVPYAGTPAQPGELDSIDVGNRYIERDYYFAMAALDVAGNRSEIATVGPVRAEFKRALIRGLGGAGEAFGRSIDGSHDFNGDGYADLVLGAGAGSAAYIYFGSGSGWPTSGLQPSVTITGPASFGYSVQVIGDIDSDGRLDLAIAAPAEGAGFVYLFKGRAQWSPTMSVADADYVVTADPGDATFANAHIGSSLARLGDFDGDTIDDFGVGGYKYESNRGYVAVIRGVAAGQAFPAIVHLGAGSTQTIEGAPAVGTRGRVGWAMTNLGPFFGTTSVLAVSGHYFGDVSVPATETHRYGAVFAFGGEIDFGSPADSVVGASDFLYLGWSMAPLGALGSPMAVAIASPAYLTAGIGSLAIHRGTTSTGPFVTDPVVITNSAATDIGDSFGSVLGSFIAGVPASSADSKSSFLGSTLPDVAVSGLAEAGAAPRLYLIDGQKVATTLSSGEIAAVADASLQLPDNWAGGLGLMPRSAAIRDLNGDGYADLALAQYARTGQYTGEVIVLW